jgi:hypothetical protein
MLKAIFSWFTGKPVPGTEAPPVVKEAVPYKVETPVAVAPVVEAAPVAVVAEVPPKKAPAKKRTFVKREEKPVAATKAPAKPRTPRPPKAK